jgi:branched-subunit amino acid ABC-type transport system permease component
VRRVNDYLPFIVIGVTTGSVFAVAALGLVLTYRTSGIFNMSHGAIAAASAFSYYFFQVKVGMPTILAVLLVLVGVAPLLGLGLELLSRRLGAATTSNKLVGTVGLLLAVQALLVVLAGVEQKPFPRFLPDGVRQIGGVAVSDDQLITVAVALASVLGLYAFLRSTRTGVAMRAVVESSDLVGLTGTSPAAVRRTAWIIGSVFAAMSGLLLAPTVGLDSLLLTLLVVQAFGAAAVGAFSSLPLTYAGGIAIGLLAAFASKFAAQYGESAPWLQGIPPSVPFLVLFVVLVLLPKARLQEVGAAVIRQSGTHATGTPLLRKVGAGVALGFGVLAPFVVGTRLPVYTAGLAYVAIFASLALLVRTSGQISLAQIGFAAVGGAAISQFTVGMGVPWLLALLLSGLVAVPLGALIAIPAIRLSGLYLALATFGFGILLDNLFYRTPLMFTRAGAVDAARPDFLFISGDSRRAYYYVVLAVVAAILIGIVVLERSRLGRLLRAMADSPLGLTTRGTSVSTTRVLVFCISSFIAAVGGALLACVNQNVNGATYPYFVSLVLLAVLTTAGPGTVSSPIVAAVAFVVIPSYLPGGKVIEGLPILFGVVALLWAMAPYDTSRLRGRVSRWVDTAQWRTSGSPALSRLEPELLEASLAGARRPVSLAGVQGGDR